MARILPLAEKIRIYDVRVNITTEFIYTVNMNSLGLFQNEKKRRLNHEHL
jgi:hypothetical protein